MPKHAAKQNFVSEIGTFQSEDTAHNTGLSLDLDLTRPSSNNYINNKIGLWIWDFTMQMRGHLVGTLSR